MDVEIEIQDAVPSVGTIREGDPGLDAVPSVGTMREGDPENGVKAQQNGAQNQQKYPRYYYTCFHFVQLVVKFLLIIIGIGLWRLQAIKKKKQTNTHAYQIMKKLVDRMVPHYGIDGMMPRMGPRESLFPMGVESPEVLYERNRPASQQTQDGFSKHAAEISNKLVKDDSKQKPVGATTILMAEKKGVREIVEKILENTPLVALELDQDKKNIVLLAIDYGQINVYQPPPQKTQDGFSKHEAEISNKQVENDSKQNPIGVKPILLATKTGVIEIVEKILENTPMAALDLDQDKKNIVLLAAEYGQINIYDHMLKRGVTHSLFGGVDKQGNSALHLAAGSIHQRRWSILGAVFQMQLEVKWYKYIERSMPPGFFTHYNINYQSAQEIFTNEHKELIKDAREWLNSTSQSASVVAALVATVAYTSATSVPGGSDQSTGVPIFEGQSAFQIFAISSLIAFCLSVTALIFFLSIVTSSFHESDFETKLPMKLMGGMTTLFMSIATNLVSFCAGHFYIIHKNLESKVYFLYAVLSFPVMAFFVMSQLPLDINLIRARFSLLSKQFGELQYF